MCLKLLRRGFGAADGMFTRASDLSGFVVFRFLHDVMQITLPLPEPSAARLHLAAL